MVDSFEGRPGYTDAQAAIGRPLASAFYSAAFEFKRIVPEGAMSHLPDGFDPHKDEYRAVRTPCGNVAQFVRPIQRD